MPITYRIRLGRRFDPPEQPRILTEEMERYFIAELGKTPCLLPLRAPLAAQSRTPQRT